MPLHVMKTIKQNECVSKNRGWESRTEGWQGLAPPWEHQRMGKVSTDVWAPGMQVVKQGFQAANTGIGQQRVLLQTNKRTNKTPSCQILLPMSFDANQEKKFWFSQQFVFQNFGFGIVTM